jgi:LacI family transcriptional regulator
LRSARGPASKAFTLWLRRLPKPVGVFACNDVVGAELLDFAGGLGIAVPEQMAVVSVDNDDLFCDLCWPPLTSIIPDPVRAGYEAASLLERLMAGQRVPDEPIFISPLGIATRQSTDVLAVDDPDIALAMKFIRDYACDGIDVRDLLRHVPLSRRVLEKRFRDLLGRSPHEEILNVKLARAKQFLLETDLNLAAIAERTGFRHMEYLCVAFKRATGKTPGAFRRGEQRPPLQDGPRSEGDRRRT